MREFAQKNIIKLGPCHLDTSLRLSPLLRKFVQKNVIKIGPCHLEWGKKMVSPSARDPGMSSTWSWSYRCYSKQLKEYYSNQCSSCCSTIISGHLTSVCPTCYDHHQSLGGLLPWSLPSHLHNGPLIIDDHNHF